MDKLLPLGTMVRCRDVGPLLMIIGYYPVQPKTERVHTYLATVYPVGVRQEGDLVLFDPDSVEQVLFTGHEDEDSEAFNGRLLRQGRDLPVGGTL